MRNKSSFSQRHDEWLAEYKKSSIAGDEVGSSGQCKKLGPGSRDRACLASVWPSSSFPESDKEQS
jgi:hypothetical protein